MKIHLKKASEEYRVKEIRKIHPVSVIDCQIIEQLVNILDDVGQIELFEILKEWKLFSDENVLNGLIQFKRNLGEKSEEEERSVTVVRKRLREFVAIGDNFRMEVEFIKSLRKHDSYDYEKNLTLYQISINQDGSNKLLIPNVTIDFNSFQERDEEYERLQLKLEKYNIQFI